MYRIIILCPGDVITGGVNSLHNLCATLVRNGFDASMYYVKLDIEVINNYQIKSYGVKRYNGALDLPGQMIIVPETMVEQLISFRKAIKVIYWLALKFYFKKPPWRFPFNIKVVRKLISCRSYYGYSSGIYESVKRQLSEYAKSKSNIWTKDYIHISNSYSVADYCKHKGAVNAFVLHNPIRDEFYNKQNSLNSRSNIILFGPKTPKLLVLFTRVFLKEFKVIQFRHMPFKKVFGLMSESKVFVALGNNPGRDRMPREAAMLGCIVFTNTRGSFALKEDYDIKKEYKIVDKLINYPRIIKKIRDAAKNYELQIEDFKEFREQLKDEWINFDSNVKKVFDKLTEKFNS